MCYKCQEITDHLTKNCPNLLCLKCGKKGHARKDCSHLESEGNIEIIRENKRLSLLNISDMQERIFNVSKKIHSLRQ